MKIKILVLFVTVLLLFTESVKERDGFMAPLEEDKVNRDKFDAFELAIDKKFSSDSVVDGQEELVAKNSEYEKQALGEMSILDPKDLMRETRDFSEAEMGLIFKDTDGGFDKKVYFSEGLNYQLNSNWAIGVQVENVLGWLASVEKEEGALMASLNSGKDAFVLFKVSYRF